MAPPPGQSKGCRERQSYVPVPLEGVHVGLVVGA